MEPLASLCSGLIGLAILIGINALFLLFAVNVVCRFSFDYAESFRVALITALIYWFLNLLFIFIFGYDPYRPTLMGTGMPWLFTMLISGAIYANVIRRPSGRKIGFGKGLLVALLQWLLTLVTCGGCGVLYLVAR